MNPGLQSTQGAPWNPNNNALWLNHYTDDNDDTQGLTNLWEVEQHLPPLQVSPPNIDTDSVPSSALNQAEQFLRVLHNLAAAIQQLHLLTDTQKTDNITGDYLDNPLASGPASAYSETSEEALPDNYLY